MRMLQLLGKIAVIWAGIIYLILALWNLIKYLERRGGADE
jgi:hypothetical protein